MPRENPLKSFFLFSCNNSYSKKYMYQAFEELSHFPKIRYTCSNEWLRGNKAYFDTKKHIQNLNYIPPYRSPG